MTVLRAGLYERVSTEEQALRGFSIDTQIDNLTEYCHKNGYRIVDHYTDEGISGAKPPLKRPALKRLIDDVKDGKIDIIIFTKLDRWFRSVQEYFKVQEILETHHVEWKAIHEDYDTTTANGRMAITIFLAIAQNEREKTSERIKVVFDHKRKKKEACFGGTPPFGYMKQEIDGVMRLVKNPEQQQATEDFWEILVKYNNLSKAAKHMNDVYGVRRVFTAWSNMLRKEIYCGWYGDIPDFCEPYVTREQWLAVQAARPAKQAKGDRVYLFTGLIRCPECGNALIPKPHKERNGATHHAYHCRHTITNVCSWKHRVAELKTEKYLLNHIEQLVNLEIEKVEAEKQIAQPKPKANRVALKEQLRHLNAMYMAGKLSDEEYLQESANLKAMIAQAAVEPSPAKHSLEPLKQFLAIDFRSAYEKLDAENKRKIWHSVIKEIIVEKNDVKEVVFS